MTPDETRDAFIAAVEGLSPTIFLTVVFNYPAGRSAGERAVNELLRRIEREAHGKRWEKFPSHLRLAAYGFFEGSGTKLHCHLAIRGDGRICDACDGRAKPLWRKLTRCGHADVQWICSVEGVSRYITKYANDQLAWDTYFVYGPTKH